MLYYSLYKFGQWLVLKLPLRFCYGLAVFLSDVHYMFADKDRLYTWQNLKAIFPHKRTKDIRRIRRRMFRNFAKYLVDFFRFPIIDQNYIEKFITLENRHHIDEALKKNKGVIVLTAHIGNWELGGLTLGVLGYPFWAVALEHKNKKVNDFFNIRRESKGVRVIQFGKAAKTCLNLLKSNKLVALLGDRDFSNEAGLVMNFFGKKSYIPKGPAAFAIKTGALIVPGFMIRNPDDTFTLRMEKPIETLPSDTMETVTAKCLHVIENYIKEYPDQWYMFRKFWAE